MQEAADNAARILKTLKYRPRGMTIADIARAAGINRTTAARQLELLRVNGQVERKEFGSAKVYYRAQRVPLSAFLCFTKNLVLVLDSANRIVQVNDPCCKLARREKDDLVGHTLADANLPVVSTPEALSIIESLEKEQIITDLRYPHEGKDLFFQLQVIPTTFEDGEKGCTLVLEDITERRRYVRNMEFLAKTAMELVDMPPDQDIHRYIANRIIELVPRAHVFVFSYDEVNRQFSMRATEGKNFHDEVVKILGVEPIGLVFPLEQVLTPSWGRDPLSLLQRGLEEFVLYPEPAPGGPSFYDLCFHQLPEDLCQEILRTQNIGKVYIAFLVWSEQLFGDVGIFLPSDVVLEDRQTIESFLRQASIALARRQTEERLHRSEQRLQEVIDLAPAPAALLDPEGRFACINRVFTDRFGYTLADISTAHAWFQRAFPDENDRNDAIAAWQADRPAARSRPIRVRCRDGTEKTVRFYPAILSDGTRYIAWEDCGAAV